MLARAAASPLTLDRAGARPSSYTTSTRRIKRSTPAVRHRRSNRQTLTVAPIVSSCALARVADGTFTDCLFVDNTVEEFAGAVYTFSSFVNYTNTDFIRCRVTRVGSNRGAGAIACFGGIFILVSPGRSVLTGCKFIDCHAEAGGALYAMDINNAAGNYVAVDIIGCHFERCTAASGGALATIDSAFRVTDTTFLDCRATAEGGVVRYEGNTNFYLNHWVRVNATRCVSEGARPFGGGAVWLDTGAFFLVEDSWFIECRAANRGGAFASTALSSNRLTARRVMFLDCSADFSGIVNVHGQILLEDCEVIGAKAAFGGVSELTPPANFTMIGGAVRGGRTEGFSVSNAGFLRLNADTNSTLIDVEVDDCESVTGPTLDVKNAKVLVRGCSFTRNGGTDSTEWSGAIRVVGISSVAIVENTYINGRGVGDDAFVAQRSLGGVEVASGSITMRNVTITQTSMTSATPIHVPTALRAATSAQIVATNITILNDCSDTSPRVLIGAVDGGVPISRALALRDFRIGSVGGCAQPSLTKALASGTSVATCAELPSLSGASCGEQASCSDVQLTPPFTTVECSCTGSTFARATAEMSKEERPYYAGCFTPRTASSVNVLGVTASSVIFRLEKSAFADSVETQTLQVRMAGTDTETGAAWLIPSELPPWLALPNVSGTLTKSDEVGSFRVIATTSMQPGVEEPYQTLLNVTIMSGLTRSFSVPVFLFVSAETVSAAYACCPLNRSP